MADKQLEDLLNLVETQDEKGIKTERYGKILVNEGKENEKTFIVKYPGTLKYLELQNDVASFARQVEETLKTVVVYPRIKDLKYFDENTDVDLDFLYPEVAKFLGGVFSSDQD